jgi:hypothetical protein
MSRKTKPLEPLKESEIARLTPIVPSTTGTDGLINSNENGPSSSSGSNNNKSNHSDDNDGKKRSESSASTNNKSESSVNKGRRKGEGHEPGPKDVKDLFEQAFKTVTLTMGSIACCIHRATAMDTAEAKHVADRLNDAVRVMSQTRIIVFKAIENFVYLKVTKSSMNHRCETVDTMMSVDVPEEFASSPNVIGSSAITNPTSTTAMDPLDLLLHKSHGATIVRNLIGMVLRGQVERTKGGTLPKSELAAMASKIAGEMYQELCLVLPDLKCSNPKDIPLGVPVMEMAVNVHSAIRTHFRRLPELIVNKVLLPLCQSSWSHGERTI